jgi:tetratricopeptide (TPR) repeat protein
MDHNQGDHNHGDHNQADRDQQRRRGGTMSRRWLLLACCLLLAYPVRSQQTPTGDDEIRKKAIELYKQNRFEQAWPLVEILAVAHPQDSALQEMLGSCRLAHSVDLNDPEERRQMRVRARQAFLRAKELGDNSNYLQIGLASIPEDGSAAPFSSRKDVDDAMRAAETAFTRGDFPGAIAGYAAVLALDPTYYQAVLFTGDVYYKQKDYEHASQWFDKAVNLGPNVETGYRYWGDVLYAQGKDNEAKDKYVLAIVAEPYQKKSWVGLIQWAQRNHVALTQPKIVSPNSSAAKPGGGTEITIDPKTLGQPNAPGKKDGMDAWIVYEGVRLEWKNKTFKEKYPQEKDYRHSLAEESDALATMASRISEELDAKEIKSEDLNPQLATLIKLKRGGLIECYVLLGHPDLGIAQDYDDYRKDHRDKLILYMNEVVIPVK